MRLGIGLLALAALVSARPSRAQAPAPVALPFSLSLGAALDIPDAPALHSFAFGLIGDRVFLIAGRTNGLHGFVPAVPQGSPAAVAGTLYHQARPDPNFPIASANVNAWVVDLATKQVWMRSLVLLPPGLRDPLVATNPQAWQDGNRLLVVGGYGLDTTTGHSTTFPILTVIDLPRAIDLVVGGDAAGDLGSAFQQVTTPPCAGGAPCPTNEMFRVTGGALIGAAGRFFLLFGQAFEGQYTPELKVTTSFLQTYTESIRIFALKPGSPPVVDWSPGIPATLILDHDHFHRRDFSAVLSVAPSGAPRLSVYGGVFRAGTMEAHMSAVHVDDLSADAPTLTVDHFKQALSQYACPTLTIANGTTTRDVYAIFFGGLSAHRYDAAERRLLSNSALTGHGLDHLGFIDQISGIATRSDGSRQGFVLRSKLPGLSGTSGAFVPRPGFEGGFVDLTKVTAATTVGYFYGGIAAATLHPGAEGSRASSLFIPVIIAPAASSADPMPEMPSGVVQR